MKLRVRSGHAAAPAKDSDATLVVLGYQPTLEHASAQAAERLVAGLPLSQALIQYCQRLFDEPRLCTLDILLRQHLSLNDPFGGGPIDDTCDAGVRWPLAAAECPTSRHILDHNVPPRKTDCVSRPSGVRARPKVDPFT